MTNTILHNKLNRLDAEKLLNLEVFEREILSFYKYVTIKNPHQLRGVLFKNWSDLGVLGRVYLANEGINAQLSIPEPNLKTFRTNLDAVEIFKNISFKYAVEKKNLSFYKLTIKVRNQIVADGLSKGEYDLSSVGEMLDAVQWNKKMDDGAIVVDMRNHYESEIGHFKGAVLPQSETFKEELPEVVRMLKGREESVIMLYCTGGIRCEKASAYLKHKGFNNVSQLSGGIIGYTQTVKEAGIENKFQGKNFVFDNRLAERITDEVISKCHQCGTACDSHTNCANLQCNLLFIQCKNCALKHSNCCSPKCIHDVLAPYGEKKKRKVKRGGKKIFHSHKKTDLSLKFNQ